MVKTVVLDPPSLSPGRFSSSCWSIRLLPCTSGNPTNGSWNTWVLGLYPTISPMKWLVRRNFHPSLYAAKKTTKKNIKNIQGTVGSGPLESVLGSVLSWDPLSTKSKATSTGGNHQKRGGWAPTRTKAFFWKPALLTNNDDSEPLYKLLLFLVVVVLLQVVSKASRSYNEWQSQPWAPDERDQDQRTTKITNIETLGEDWLGNDVWCIWCGPCNPKKWTTVGWVEVTQ